MDDQLPKGISRRSMLKRIGAGAAVAWSAPVLTSIRTPAFAQYVCAGGCPACQFGEFCLDCGGCVGLPDECICANVGICQPEQPICSSDADCEAFCAGGRCASCIFDPSCNQTSCWCPCGNGQAPARIPRGRGVRVIRPSR